MLSVAVRSRAPLRSIQELLRPDKATANSVSRALDPVFRREMAENFGKEGTPAGAWAPLSPAYKARKDRLFNRAVALNQSLALSRRGKKLSKATMRKVLGAENKILQLTGRMKRAYTKPGAEHVARGAVLPRRGLVVYLGVHGPAYYGYHDEGAGKLPRRSSLIVDKAALDDMNRASMKAMLPHVMARVRALDRLVARFVR
jgi:hypothetical protein